LRQATAAGHNIGQAAKLSDDELRVLVRDHSAPRTSDTPSLREANETPAKAVELCLRHIVNLDSRNLDDALGRAAVRFGSNRILHDVIVPLIQRIGDLWEAGTLKIAHEHFASSVIRNFLATSYRPLATPETAPLLMAATPSGQLHELGAVLACAVASNQGWRTTYLGSSLPTLEVAGAAMQNNARAVALSVVYPEDDPQLAQELVNLRRFLPDGTALLVGGRAAAGYCQTLKEIGAIRITELRELSNVLQNLRATPAD
jgi:methanogenic corrinoid protein MtbC1